MRAQPRPWRKGWWVCASRWRCGTAERRAGHLAAVLEAPRELVSLLPQTLSNGIAGGPHLAPGRALANRGRRRRARASTGPLRTEGEHRHGLVGGLAPSSWTVARLRAQFRAVLRGFRCHYWQRCAVLR